jgi:hypothetical protein
LAQAYLCSELLFIPSNPIFAPSTMTVSRVLISFSVLGLLSEAKTFIRKEIREIPADGLEGKPLMRRDKKDSLTVESLEDTTGPVSFLEASTTEQQLVNICGLAKWNPWTECSKRCGGGRQTRTREAMGLLGSYSIVDKNSAALLEGHDVDMVHQDFQVNNDAGDFITVLAKEKAGEPEKDHFNVRWVGQILIEKAGRYVFNVKSGGGSRLKIGASLLADGKEETSRRVFLTKGAHAIDLQVFGKVGEQNIGLTYSGPDTDNAAKEVPTDVLRHWSSNSICQGALLQARDCNVDPCE